MASATFAQQVLRGIGAPVNANTTTAMQEWLAAEGGSNNNPLNRKTGPGGPIASYSTEAQGAAATVAVINQSNMTGVKQAFVSGSDPAAIKSAIIASPWSENHYAGTTYGASGTGQITLASDVTKTTTTTLPATTAPTAAQTAAAEANEQRTTSIADTGEHGTAPTVAAVKGSGVTNFHGYDLSAIPANELPAAEQAITKYIADPNYAATINQKISQDYGYSGSWIQKVPELNGILIWASTSLDPTSQTDQNLFLGALEGSNWWNATDQNQRAWDEVQSQDPATAHEALIQAQDKVLATANQVGVTLTKSQLDQIANTYAAQSYTPTGVLGSQSGTSQEWLDQAVVDTAMNVKSTGSVTGNGALVNENYANGKTDLSSTTNPADLSGITQQLFSAFQTAAQNYLLYDPNNPNSGLLTTADLMKSVDQAMQNYTGTGSSGLASEFVNNAQAQFTQQAMQQASSVYPTLAPVIAQGTSPSAYITPTANYVASQIGMSSGQINVMDPQWNWLISTPNPTTGVKGPVTQDQALQKITSPGFSWTDPNGQRQTWDNTNTAVQNATSLTNGLASMFGVGGQ